MKIEVIKTRKTKCVDRVRTKEIRWGKKNKCGGRGEAYISAFFVYFVNASRNVPLGREVMQH